MKKTANYNSGKKQLWRAAALMTAAVLGVTGINGCAVKPQRIQPPAALVTAKADVQTLTKAPEPVSGPVDLGEAIARAIKFNREKEIKAMESALALRQIDVARYAMLPSLTVSAGYHESGELTASASGTLVNGQIVVANPPTYSVSQDKQRHSESLSLTWNILDFGLAYVRAGQQADRYLVAKERERKVVQNIIQDVQSAYWRAISAEHLLTRVTPLMSRAHTALDASRNIEQKRLEAPLDVLGYQRELLDILRNLQVLQRDLISANSELAALMGLPPGQTIRLAGGGQALSVPKLTAGVEQMEEIALTNRPELMEGRYQERIAQKEVRAALLGMLPTLSLNAGMNHDSNDFLLHQSWNEYGAQVAWNMFNVCKGPAAMKVSRAQADVARAQTMAMSMAVVSQVHLSDLRFRQAVKEYELSAEYLDVVNRITDQTRASEQAKRAGELKVIREELNLVVAELRRDMSHAEMQNSFARLFASMGIDPLPGEVTNASVAMLARVVNERLAAWRMGQLPPATAPAAGPAPAAAKDGNHDQ